MLVRGTVIFLLTFLASVHLAAAQAPVSGGPVDAQLIEDLVAANRILADQGVLDAYGHVSIQSEPLPGLSGYVAGERNGRRHHGVRSRFQSGGPARP
jgi:hypothetical protein